MTDIDISAVYVPSDDVVARFIEGELLIVPLAAGIGDMEDELYTLNDTGQAIWQRLDGSRTLADVVSELAIEYSTPVDEIERDVVGLMRELAQRKIVVRRG
jgi:hypothetical protein